MGGAATSTSRDVGGQILTWRLVSSSTGDLPAPGSSTQQTAALILDVDRDGVNDFVIGARQGAPALVWYQRKTAGWQRRVIDPEPLNIEAGGAAADIDGDGDLDVVMGEDSRGVHVWWWENPRPDFDRPTGWMRREIKRSGGRGHHDQIFGDFDGDGRLELVFWNQDAATLFMAEIPKDPRGAAPWPLVPIYSAEGEGLAQADIDGDGRVDLLAGGYWLKHRVGKQFTPHRIDDTLSNPRLAVADLKEGGRPEVVMAPGEMEGMLRWYEATGDPTHPESWVKHDLLRSTVIHAHSLGVADFNADGHLDVFCAEMGHWTASAEPDNPEARSWIFLGDGQGHFTTVEIATGRGYHEAKVGDLDGDGDPDILAKPYHMGAPRIDVWLNDRPPRRAR